MICCSKTAPVFCIAYCTCSVEISNLTENEFVGNLAENTGACITMGNFPLSPTDTNCHTSGAKLSHQHLHCHLLGCEWWGYYRRLPGLLYGGAANQQRCRGCVRSCPFCPGLGKLQGSAQHMRRRMAVKMSCIGLKTGNCWGDHEQDIVSLLPLCPRKCKIISWSARAAVFTGWSAFSWRGLTIRKQQRGCVHAAPLLLIGISELPRGQVSLCF